MAQVPVYRKDTGEKVYVPEHWVGHKTLGRMFRKTPLTSGEGSKKAPASAGTTTKKEGLIPHATDSR